MATTEPATFGIAHPTVVPTNFEPDVPDAATASRDPEATADRDDRPRRRPREQ